VSRLLIISNMPDARIHGFNQHKINLRSLRFVLHSSPGLDHRGPHPFCAPNRELVNFGSLRGGNSKCEKY